MRGMMDDIVYRIAEKAAERGGTAYFVGGCVRDMMMGKESKDIDIEIHNIIPSELEIVLDDLGKRIETGKSFGVYSLKGHNVDIAMPRREKATGSGHRDFRIDVDPYIGEKEAARRRDFTINSIMRNVLTGEIKDNYGGIDDIKNRIIRHVDDNSFPEDPLRVLRAAQFSARLGFKIAPKTEELCRGIDITSLSAERVMGEMKKALMQAETPSVFFEVLRKTDQLDFWFYELKKLIGVKQNENYHKEGDVWTHTMMVLDEAAKVRDTVSCPLYFMISALVHDLGKPEATEIKDGVAHAYMHEIKGLKYVESFLKRLTNERDMIKYALNMTALHMKPNVAAGAGSSVKSTNRMFDESAAPLDLIALSQCDGRGKLPRDDKKLAENLDFLTERYGVFMEYMSRPYVTGKDLIDAGLEPGESLGDALRYAHKLRLAGVEKDSAIKQTLSYARKKKRKDKKK